MRIAFDIGGTHMRVARSRDGKTLERIMVHKTPAAAAEGIARLVAAARALSEGEPIESVTGGIAGIVTDGTVHSSPNLPGWERTDVASALSSAFPEAAVRVENDALAGALGEARRGAGAGNNIVAYLAVGTGIGGARVVEGKMDARHDGFEPGKQILDVGSGETFEELASGPAIVRRYGVSSVQELSDEQVKKVAAIIADGAYNAVVHWSPDIVVLGGGAIASDSRMVPAVRGAIEKIPTTMPLPPVVAARFGDESALHGALELVSG
ncbi:MAG: ROK family protein [bacterium]|nr:ROK family protein [bacterium]